VGPRVNDRFPVTRPSVVTGATGEDPVVRERAVRTLAESYWRPIYAYLRWKWRATPEDAEDLTQGFFVVLLERDLVAKFDAGRGRFRTYLRTCLDGWVSNERKSAGRLKRGGGLERLSLDFANAEAEIARLPGPSHTDPEEMFRREWARSLFAWTLDALEGACAASGHERRAALFRRYDVDPPPEERPTYAELAAEFGVPVTQVTNELHAVRRRFRELLLGRLRELTATDEEFREEARELLGGDPA